MKNKLTIAAIILIVAALATYDILYNKDRDNNLKDAVVIIGKVDSIEVTRGLYDIDVEYPYHGVVIHNSFGTGNVDSLKNHPKIRLLVSKKHPDKYIKYIGLADTTKIGVN